MRWCYITKQSEILCRKAMQKMEKTLKEIAKILMELSEQEFQDAKNKISNVKTQKVRELLYVVLETVDKKREMYKGMG